VYRMRQLHQIAAQSVDGVFDANRRGGGGHLSSISLHAGALPAS
jgi:hypothetical protein